MAAFRHPNAQPPRLGMQFPVLFLCFCEGQHALAPRGCSAGWNTKGAGGLARSFLPPFPCPRHGYSSCPGAVLVTELDRKGCVLCSVRVPAALTVGLLLLQSNMIILAFPGTWSVGNPSVLCLWLPWEQLPAVLCVRVSVSWRGSCCDC